MQLPRGTFRSIRKGVSLSDILSELARSRFRGIGTLSSVSLTGTLVFRNGACVLAKVQDRYGDPAWNLITSQPDIVTDIALSDIDNAQLQLALDFNKKAKVAPSLKAIPKQAVPPAPVSPAKEHPLQRQRPAARKEVKEREFIKTTPVAPAAPVSPPPAERPADGTPVKKADARPEPPAEPARSPSEEDLDTFEDMDLDEVAQKIRKDCKIILKQLQLDHLTEK